MRKLAANSKPEEFRHSIGGAAILLWTAAGHEADVATGVLVEKPWVMLIGCACLTMAVSA
jgi:hypothetical protein